MKPHQGHRRAPSQMSERSEFSGRANLFASKENSGAREDAFTVLTRGARMARLAHWVYEHRAYAVDDASMSTVRAPPGIGAGYQVPPPVASAPGFRGHFRGGVGFRLPLCQLAWCGSTVCCKTRTAHASAATLKSAPRCSSNSWLVVTSVTWWPLAWLSPALPPLWVEEQALRTRAAQGN